MRDYKSEYDFTVTVYSPEYGTGDRRKIQAQKDIEAAVSSSRMDGNINLPQYIADSKVYYEESEKACVSVIICPSWRGSYISSNYS